MNNLTTDELKKIEQLRKELYPKLPGDKLPERWYDHRNVLTNVLYNQDLDFLFKCLDFFIQQFKA
jgi:hypothetical protein